MTRPPLPELPRLDRAAEEPAAATPAGPAALAVARFRAGAAPTAAERELLEAQGIEPDEVLGLELPVELEVGQLETGDLVLMVHSVVHRRLLRDRPTVLLAGGPDVVQTAAAAALARAVRGVRLRVLVDREALDVAELERVVGEAAKRR